MLVRYVAGFCKVSIHTELIIYGMVLQFEVQGVCDEICCRFPQSVYTWRYCHRELCSCAVVGFELLISYGMVPQFENMLVRYVAGFCKVSIHTELIIYGMVLQFKVQDICNEICCRFPQSVYTWRYCHRELCRCRLLQDVNMSIHRELISYDMNKLQYGTRIWSTR
jgi:hypothetical protein